MAVTIKFNFLYKICKLLYLIVARDLALLIFTTIFRLRMLWAIKTNEVVVKFFDHNARKYSKKTAILYGNEKHSFKDIQDLSMRISNWLETGLQMGCDDKYEMSSRIKKEADLNSINVDKPKIKDEKVLNKIRQHQNTVKIGLMFGNVPEMISFITGIARVRCASVLFNTNHRGDMLVNAINTAECKLFIFESKYLPALREIADRLPEDVHFIMFDRKSLSNYSHESIGVNYKGFTQQELVGDEQKLFEHAEKFVKVLLSFPDAPPKRNYPYKVSDPFIYVFTSGTTGGNAKAATVTNTRYLMMLLMQRYVVGIKSTDNIYTCVPIYHALGGFGGIGCAIINGSTVTLVDKFSASRFWKDCCEYGCTVALYIGEICRFLLAQPSNEYENKHKVRIFNGAGMNGTFWKTFQKRFKVKRIFEAYGSSEGNTNVINYMGEPGSCGFIPYYFGPIVRLIYPIELMRVDPETNELVRDKNGLCVPAKPGDIGMLVGEIREGNQFTDFAGYTSVKESSKKIIRNVRRHGDFAFVSGDLMKMDFYGNLFFQDRTGDTFRWKGENVSTTEIENICSAAIDQAECVVYGVKVPNCDGRAGMMATTKKDIDLDKFYQAIKSKAPQYALPKFIRITDQIPRTSTQKYMKTELRNVGFDLDRIQASDQLFYFDPTTKKYSPLDREVNKRILANQIKF